MQHQRGSGARLPRAAVASMGRSRTTRALAVEPAPHDVASMASRRTTVPAQVLAAMKLVLALMLGAAAAFAPQTASRASTSLSVGPVGEQKLTTKGPSSKFSMDNQYAMGHMGKYDDAATEDERSKKFLARHDGDVGAELGSLQVRTPERVAAEIAQIKADRQARVRRAKKLN